MAGFTSSSNGDLTSDIFMSDSSVIDELIGDSLLGWGGDTRGQLGAGGPSGGSSYSPILTVAGGTNWKQVACGTEHTAAIKTDGTLWLWGYNNGGQLGDNTLTDKSSPVQTVTGGTNWKQVSCSKRNSAAIKTDGTLWLWGSNGQGQLGDNTTVSKSSPVQTVAGGTNWKQVSFGANDTVGAIKTDGTLWMWGRNDYGQLGDNGTSVSKSSPVQTVTGGTNWKQVSCGFDHTGAIKTDGTLWMWGNNSYGQLGAAGTGSSPIQTVAGGTNWKQVACGGTGAAAGKTGHTAAIKTDGTLWLWGLNDLGQLGNNLTSGGVNSSPTQTVTAGTNWKQVSCGGCFTSAIKTDGTLWLWGDGGFGQMGDSTPVPKSSPVQTAAGGTNWKQVSSGSQHSGAVTSGKVT